MRLFVLADSDVSLVEIEDGGRDIRQITRSLENLVTFATLLRCILECGLGGLALASHRSHDIVI